MKRILIASSLLTFGCIDALKDSDGDGISDAEEAELGTDPESEDSDGDGISDSEEVELGTDPTETDSDGDGYLDNWEIDEDTDPTDEDDKIYTGGWPYNPDKGDLDIPSSADLSVGAGLVDLQLMDQYGETVNLYDFAGQGKPVLIDISAIWCGPCNGLASWLSGQGDNYGFGDYWSNVPELVENGDVYWLTVLGQNNQGDIPSESDLAEWYADYPDPKIPVLADDSGSTVASNYLLGGWPTTILFDENLNIISLPTDDNFWAPMDELNAYTPE